MNSRNKYTKRTGSIPVEQDRPEWQKDRGERYGNRRKEIARLKWKERRQQRHVEKRVDFL